MLTLQIDSKVALSQITALYESLTGYQIRRAVSQGINITMRTARAKTAKAIRRQYNIPYGFLIHTSLKVAKANPTLLTSTLSMATAPIPVGKFLTGTVNAPKSSKMAGKRNHPAMGMVATKSSSGGIIVQILKGHSEFLPGVFISKKTGMAVARSVQDGQKRSYNRGPNKDFHGRHGKGSRISSGKDSPIGALFTKSPFFAALNKKVQEDINAEISPKLTDNIIRQLDAMEKGYIKNANRNRDKYGRYTRK